jgi:hypothetical protein
MLAGYTDRLMVYVFIDLVSYNVIETMWSIVNKNAVFFLRDMPHFSILYSFSFCQILRSESVLLVDPVPNHPQLGLTAGCHACRLTFLLMSQMLHDISEISLTNYHSWYCQSFHYVLVNKLRYCQANQCELVGGTIVNILISITAHERRSSFLALRTKPSIWFNMEVSNPWGYPFKSSIFYRSSMKSTIHCLPDA